MSQGKNVGGEDLYVREEGLSSYRFADSYLPVGIPLPPYKSLVSTNDHRAMSCRLDLGKS